jgi:hypothetical protein
MLARCIHGGFKMMLPNIRVTNASVGGIDVNLFADGAL